MPLQMSTLARGSMQRYQVPTTTTAPPSNLDVVSTSTNRSPKWARLAFHKPSTPHSSWQTHGAECQHSKQQLYQSCTQQQPQNPKCSMLLQQCVWCRREGLAPPERSEIHLKGFHLLVSQIIKESAHSSISPNSLLI